jgi:hypothetical protein
MSGVSARHESTSRDSALAGVEAVDGAQDAIRAHPVRKDAKPVILPSWHFQTVMRPSITIVSPPSTQ